MLSASNYGEIYAQYLTFDQKLILLAGSTVDTDRLLKFVEDYRGDLAVYFIGKVSSVLLSRFNYMENRRKYQRKEFPELTKVEQTVKRIKELIT